MSAGHQTDTSYEVKAQSPRLKELVKKARDEFLRMSDATPPPGKAAVTFPLLSEECQSIVAEVIRVYREVGFSSYICMLI